MLLRSFLDHWHTPAGKYQLTRHPFDIDGGANSYIFRKHSDDG